MNQTPKKPKQKNVGIRLSGEEVLMLQNYREATGEFISVAIREEIKKLVIPENPAQGKRLYIAFTPRQYEHLGAYCEAIGLTRSTVIRQLIHKIYKQLKTEVYQ
jgi:predicted DNA-binding protein